MSNIYTQIPTEKHVKPIQTLLRKIKDLNKCTSIPCSWFVRLTIVKMSILSILMYKNQTAIYICHMPLQYD